MDGGHGRLLDKIALMLIPLVEDENVDWYRRSYDMI